MNTAKSQVGVCVCVCVWKEFIKNCAKRISNEQINASLMTFLVRECLSDSVCIGNLFHIILTKNVEINTLVMHR